MVTQKVTALWIGADINAADAFNDRLKQIDANSFSVSVIGTLQEALVKIPSHQFNVVFIDSKPSGQSDDWWHAFEKVSQLLPVVLLARGDDEAFVFSALKKGAVDFIHFDDANANSILKTLRHAFQSFSLAKELMHAKRNDEAFKEQFLAAQKMESVGRLALGVAHDFNNLLTVILNYSQMVLSKAKDDETLRNRMEAISNCANRAATITSQFLAFGRKHKPQPQAVSLSSIFSMVEPLLRQSLGTQIDLKISEAEAGLKVFMDPNHIMHVVMSMVQSSHESMPEGGSLWVTTTAQFVDEERSNQLGSISPGDYVVISVKDSGRGYDTESTEHIFELFGGEKNENSAPASLSATNSMVKHAGGFIEVQSEVGKGTQFNIYLPKYTEEEQTVVVEEKKEAPASKSLETILVVDDEEMVRKIAVDVMTQQGYKVIEASSAIEALKLCEQNTTGVDLVLTDLIMPKMNGPELVRKMIAKNPHLRVVYMSGYSDDAFEPNEGLETKESFVQKPFLPKNLIGAVKEALSRPSSLSG